MAYTCPKDMDGFMPHLPKADTRFRLQVGSDLLAFLAEPSNPIVCQDIGQFIDNLIPWMQSSNYKVSSNGIEVLTYLVDRLGTDFKPYIQTVLPNVIDRLGDAKDTVREKSQLLILKLLERNVLTPQALIEKLQPSFSHKNAKIREEVLRCLVNTLNEHGAKSLSLNKFTGDIVTLLSDPTATVRDTAFNTLVDLYKHVGEKLRAHLQRSNIVPHSKWIVLAARFEEVKSNGELLPTASKSSESLNLDEIDRAVMAKTLLPSRKPLMSSATKQRSYPPTPSSANAVFSRVGSMRLNPKTPVVSGAVDDELFVRGFEDCPTVQIFSAREVTEQLKNIQDIISDSNKDWNKRADALKKIRSLVIAGATNFEEFYIGLRNLEIPLQGTLKDLRSQVVREACITISYLAQTLGNRFDKTAECVLQHLINLIQNSAKVMASSGQIAVKFIIQNTYSPRLIPVISSNAHKSKSKDIRRSCYEFLDMMLTLWPTHPLERHVAALQESIKKGVADADPEARVSSRKAFRGFRDHFPEQAEALLQSLEPSYRRALQGDGISASSSNNNISGALKASNARLYRTPTRSATDSAQKGRRSNSAIDLQAAQRAKARAQYSAMARNKIQSGTASLPRPKKSPETFATASPERIGRRRSRSSQSQPTSRSGSPSSRLYLYQRATEHDSPRTRRMSSGIPRSTQGSRDTSRETSPNRNRYRRSSDRPPLSPAARPVLAQKILQQSREAENALADAFSDPVEPFRPPRKTMRSLENHSDESESSSVCSERSNDYDTSRMYLDDINEILSLCACTNWQERKDGLLSLQHYLRDGLKITTDTLKCLTEIFTRMFMDSHTKGLSQFIDTLHDVIKECKHDLHFWVYTLLQRVFLKIGTETLNSIQSKLMSTLDLLKSSFPVGLLVSNVYRFLIDPTQTPNARVKTVVLMFLSSLCNNPEAASYVSHPPAAQALQKIVAYSQDSKSVDIRNAAKACVIAIWNCNTPQVTMMLAELPKPLQDSASGIVHSHMRKSSTGSEPGSPMATGSPKPLSPTTSPLRDGVDQEEIYRSLRKTTAEIQNYSFETFGSKLDRVKATTSQDSGISQMSVGNDVKNGIGILEERMEDLVLTNRSGSTSLPYMSVNGISSTHSNSNRVQYKDLESQHTSYPSSVLEAEQIVADVMQYCMLDSTSKDEKRRFFCNLLKIIESNKIELIKINFNKLLRVLIENLNEDDGSIQVIILQILSAIFRCHDLKPCWSEFIELLTLRVLKCHWDEKREVVREAEKTAQAMAVFPFNTIVNTLAPLTRTETYPSLIGVIKMLTHLIEANPSEVTDDHLAQIMPGIIKGTDHAESPVRKCSIFCMVAIHKAVGEDRLSSYIIHLTGSKMKLLRLYIRRPEDNKSMPTSPKNNKS